MFGGFPIGGAPIGGAGGPAVVPVSITDGVQSTTVMQFGWNNAILEGIVATSPLTPLVTAMLVDLVSASTPYAASLTTHASVTDSANATTAMTVAFSVSVEDSVNGTTMLSLTYSQVAALIDGILASGACKDSLQAQNAVVETLFALDKLTRDFPISASDAIALADDMQSRLAELVIIADAAVATTLVESSANLTFVVSDVVEATDDISTMLAMNESINDGVVAVLSFALNGDVFTGIVINTETAAVTEYTNFPFNSFAMDFGGKDYGIADDGIYLLEGPDDDGTPIESFVRTGLIRVADGHKARIPTAYFGYSATGKLVMKVITTHPDGTKSENWYQLEQRNAAAPRSNRVKMGRGLASVYWSFELHSVDGSTFDLDTIQLYPMTLSRRI